MAKALLLVVFCALASGCVSDQERTVQAQNIAEADAQACSFYGFKPGTPEFSQCRMARDQNRQLFRFGAYERLFQSIATAPAALLSW